MAKKSAKEFEQQIEAVEAKIASYKTKIDELEVEKQNLRDRLSNAYYLERLVASGINLKVLAVTEENVSSCRFLVTLENGLQTWNARKVKVGSTMRFTADYVKLMEECRDAKVKAQTIKN